MITLRNSFLLISILYCINPHSSYSQTYTEQLDTFYVPTPEYSATLGLDSLFFPCAVTTPDSGTKFPVVILVHGTASLDKDASSTKDYQATPTSPTVKAQTKMFYELADHLSSNGIMVLRYDKRSYTVNCIENKACWWADTISPYDYIKDIKYAVDFVKTHSEVDTCNIFVLGHSQGANFVADVGLARNDVRGVISMAPTAEPIDSVVIYQTEFVDSDPTGAAIVREQFDSLRNGLWPMNDTLYNQKFSPRFWLDWLSITDSAIITQNVSTKPTLMMYGTIDQAVPPATHYTIWQDSITRQNMTFMLFDDLDHSFGPIDDSTIAPNVLDSLANWVNYQSQDCGVYAFIPAELNLDVSVFPNPTSGKFTIAFNNIQEDLDVIIRSVDGRIISTESYSNTQEISSFLNEPKGIYFVELSNDNGEQSVIRLVKI